MMNTRERFVRTLTGQPVDRVPFIKVFGGDNARVPEWERDEPDLAQTLDRKLRFEGGYRGWRITPVAFGLTGLDAPVVLEETAEKVVHRHGDGHVTVRFKGGDYHAHTLEFAVKSRADWDRIKSRHLAADDPERFPADWSARVAEYRTRDYPLQLTHGGVYGFARNLMGDEALGLAFYDDPDLVHDMMDSYTDMLLALWGRMTPDTDFDLIECWEDMASKNGMLISPDLFREFMKPNYEKVADFARRHRIPIILVDSDGYIEDLAPLMLESGVTAMYPFEVQAGNDVFRVRERLPGLGVIGGLDKESMARGRADMDAELEKARRLIRLGRFIPGPDHFVLSNVPWANYRYFMERLREVVLTTTPGPG
jgi:uroporphyrinogen decarboxylase